MSVHKRRSWKVEYRDPVSGESRSRTFESEAAAEEHAAKSRAELGRSEKVTIRARHAWQVKYRDPDGNQRSETFAIQKDAERFERETRVKMSRGEWLARDDENKTLGEWWPEWVAGRDWRSSSRTTHDRHWRNWIQPTFGRRALRNIKPVDVEKWHREMERAGLAPATRGAIHRSLAMALRAAERNGLIVRPPLTAPKVAPAKPSIPNAEQVTAIIEAWPERLRAFPTVIARAGLRPAEAAGLVWDSVDLDGAVIHVDRQLVDNELGPLKTDESTRDIGIDDELVAVLRTHKRLMNAEAMKAPGRSRSELLFTTNSGAPMGRPRIGEHWRRATEDLDVGEGVRGPHALRHFHASALLTAGVPVHEVAKRLGHKNATITLSTYAHVLDTEDADDRARAAITAAFE